MVTTGKSDQSQLASESEKYNLQKKRNIVYRLREIHMTKSKKYILQNQ